MARAPIQSAGSSGVPVDCGDGSSPLLLPSHDNGPLISGKGAPMGSALILRQSEFSVVWLPTKPSVDATMPPPRYLKNDPVSNKQAVPGMRGPRAIARFLVAFCIGVVATLAWQTYSDAARELVASSSSPQVASIAQTTPDVIAPTASAVSSPDQQDFAALRQSVDQLAASQLQINRSVMQLASAQEQTMRDISRLQKSERYIVSKMSVPLPRPAPAQTRMHASRPAMTTAGAGPNAHHAVPPSTSIASSSPLLVLLTRLDTGPKRTRSSAADARSSAPAEPFSQTLMSALSRITGIRL